MGPMSVKFGSSSSIDAYTAERAVMSAPDLRIAKEPRSTVSPGTRCRALHGHGFEDSIRRRALADSLDVR